MMIFRALVMVLFLGGLALADMSADPALAQETKAGRPAGGQTPAVPPTFDPIAARIKYLHDRLRITPDQEPLWDTVAQVIRNNAQDTTPLLRERLRAKTSGSALDVLHSYEALGEAQLDSLNKFIAAFHSLYVNLSESQKKIVDNPSRGPAEHDDWRYPGSPRSLRFSVGLPVCTRCTPIHSPPRRLPPLPRQISPLI